MAVSARYSAVVRRGVLWLHVQHHLRHPRRVAFCVGVGVCTHRLWSVRPELSLRSERQLSQFESCVRLYAGRKGWVTIIGSR